VAKKPANRPSSSTLGDLRRDYLGSSQPASFGQQRISFWVLSLLCLGRRPSMISPTDFFVALVRVLLFLHWFPLPVVVSYFLLEYLLHLRPVCCVLADLRAIFLSSHSLSKHPSYCYSRLIIPTVNLEDPVLNACARKLIFLVPSPSLCSASVTGFGTF